MAEGAGVSELVLSGITPTPPHPTITKVGRAKDRKVRWRYARQPVDSLLELKKDGYRVIALEVTDEAHPYHLYSYPEKVCLVAGHEDHGVTREILSCCDDAVFIPMYGKGRSHNVATAVAIVTYRLIHATE
jgi:23S rRNA (guanosine2251-2'-O)-methyltransferase